MFATYAKAVVGAIVAALGAATVAVSDGFTTGEWLAVASAFFVALAAVWAVPNRLPDGDPLVPEPPSPPAPGPFVQGG
jgi:drug/metabolite transporter (DMT)-like permease